jgi:hypothetical protein
LLQFYLFFSQPQLYLIKFYLFDRLNAFDSHDVFFGDALSDDGAYIQKMKINLCFVFTDPSEIVLLLLENYPRSNNQQ